MYRSLKSPISGKTRQVYVGKYTDDETILEQYYYKVLAEEFILIYQDIENNSYTSDYISNPLIKFLDYFFVIFLYFWPA